MKQDYSLRVRLVITSKEITPNDISAALRISPTKTWVCGQRVHPKATKLFAENGWELSVDSDAEELVAGPLIDQLIASFPIAEFIEIKSRCNGDIAIELSVVAYLSSPKSAPSISLDLQQIKFLEKIGASFDLDLYF